MSKTDSTDNGNGQGPSWTDLTEKDMETLDQVSRNLMQASLKSQKLMSDVMAKALEGDPVMPQADPFHSAPEFGEVWIRKQLYVKLLRARNGLRSSRVKRTSSVNRPYMLRLCEIID